MPTIKQLPQAVQVAATDQVPLSQGGVTRGAQVGTLLASAQPRITLAPAALLGRVSPVVGGPEAVGVGPGLSMSGGALAATAADHLTLPTAAALSSGDEVLVNSGAAPRRMPATALRGLFTAGPGVQIDASGVITAPSSGTQGPKGDPGPPGAPAPAVTDASALPVTAVGASVARNLASRAADQVNARDFGAALDDAADDTAALSTALNAARTAARPVTLPSGTARVQTPVAGLAGRLSGEGQVRTADGHKRAPRFSRRTTPPASYGNGGDINQAFDGDLSTVHLAIEHRIEGDDTLTKPATSYVMNHENSAITLSMLNSSGWNQATNDQAGGRTGVSAINGNVGNVGQGDAYFLHAGGFVAGTKPGSTHFLANPALVTFSGGLFSFSDGTYQEVDEFSHDDGGFGAQGYDIAVSSTVRNFNRTNDTGAKGAWWLAFRLQSAGTKAVDVAMQVTGRWNNLLDTTAMIAGPNKAVWTQGAGQRTYLNASAYPDGFSNPAKISVGTTYTHYNPATNAFEVVVGGTTALSVGAGAVRGLSPPSGSNDTTLATTAFVKTAVTGITSQPGPAGPAGTIGPAGPAGVIGPVGPAGAVGAAGAVGPAGPVGSAGATGATGLQGPPGPLGAVGPAGVAGSAGPVGATGATGLQGPPGPIGLTGPAGHDGAAGPVGPAGSQGLPGSVGATGPAGPAGATGATGLQGSPGPIGTTGPAGNDGAAGPVGPAGPQGLPGSVGATGPAGATGAQGPAGPTQPATTAAIGAVKPGAGLAVAADGTLSATGGSAYLNNVLQSGQAGALPRLDIYTAPGPYTWTKLGAAALVDILLIGAGGGGGAGGVFASGTTCSGGAGGGAGARTAATVPASLVAASVAGNVATPGAGGVGSATTGTGASGSNAAGGTTTFGPLSAYGGQGGAGGGTASLAAGGAGGGLNAVGSGGGMGASSNAAPTAVGGGPGGTSASSGGGGTAGKNGDGGGPASGAAGAGLSAAGAANTGGAGGAVSGSMTLATAAIGASGPDAKAAPFGFGVGASGGSGASNATGNGGNGGAGSGYGAGGSGGGSCLPGGAAGSGAAGTPALVMIVQR